MSSQGIVAKVALPYAEALLEAAQAQNSIETTNKDLSLINTLLSGSLELQVFLDNPLVKPEVKKSVLNDLLVNQVNSFVLKFLLVLVDRRRINLLKNVIEKYLELSYALDSITLAEVRTSIAFTEEQKTKLVQQIKQLTGSKEVRLVITIEPELIAGFIVQIGSKVIDTSLAGKLRQMSFYLNGNTN